MKYMFFKTKENKEQGGFACYSNEANKQSYNNVHTYTHTHTKSQSLYIKLLSLKGTAIQTRTKNNFRTFC
jgi:hypothetical protein